MARVPDEVPRDIFPEPPLDELINPDPPGDPDDWDPVGLTLLGRWFTRAYLRAQAHPDPDE